MHKTPKHLIGGSTEKLEKKRKVTAEELRQVMARSGAAFDPWGLNGTTNANPTNH